MANFLHHPVFLSTFKLQLTSTSTLRLNFVSVYRRNCGVIIITIITTTTAAASDHTRTNATYGEAAGPMIRKHVYKRDRRRDRCEVTGQKSVLSVFDLLRCFRSVQSALLRLFVGAMLVSIHLLVVSSRLYRSIQQPLSGAFCRSVPGPNCGSTA